MKTPKEILLEQHAEATPALDRIRGRVVDGLKHPASTKTMGADFWSQAWEQVIWEPRRIWCSLASAWVIMLAIGLSTSGSESSQSARPPKPDRPVLERHHNALRAELELPEEQRAEDSPRTIRQSHHPRHTYA